MARSAAGLLEREREFAQLAGALVSARSGRGRIVLVEAPAGVGKTSLLAAGAAAAAEQGFLCLSARGSELESEFAYGCARQLLEPVVVKSADSERSRMFAGAAALSEPLFGMSAGDVGAAPDDPSFPILHGLYWLLENLAAKRPLVLAFDDLQWSDLASLRFVNYLAPRLDGVAVAVLGSVRTGDPGARRPEVVGLGLQAGTTVLRPRPLTGAGTSALCRRRLGAGVSPEFEGACHEATGGNPFFLEELLRDAVEGGIIGDAREAERVGHVGPAAISRAILLRLAGRPPAATALVRAAAVVGEGAGLGVVARLAGLDADAAEGAAGLLTGRTDLPRALRSQGGPGISGSSMR